MKIIRIAEVGLTLALVINMARAAEMANCSFRLRVTSPLPCPKNPMDPMIDFGAMLRKAGLNGVLDPRSIWVVNVSTGQTVSNALSEHFTYDDKGRVQWVIEDPAHTKYEIRFQTAARRFPLVSRSDTPLIGTGDLLRYNTDAPRPFPPIARLSRLIDLTGDGKPDLAGCGGYAYAPGSPFSGIFCYPRVGDPEKFQFGDLVRVRYLEKSDSKDFKHFTPGYIHADIADMNRDGLPDIAFTAMKKSAHLWGNMPDVHKSIHLYLNTGRQDAGGMPMFVLSDRLEHPQDWWGPVLRWISTKTARLISPSDRCFAAKRSVPIGARTTSKTPTRKVGRCGRPNP